MSLVSHKANFDYHFSYNRDGRFFQPFRSMLASDKFLNVAWTAPLLIGGGAYLQSKIGALASTKFFLLSIISTYLWTTTFGPQTQLGQLSLKPLYDKMMPEWSNFDLKSGQMVGADGIAHSVMYMILFYHRMWPVAGAIALFDVSYYGLYGVNAPATAAFAALTLL